MRGNTIELELLAHKGEKLLIPQRFSGKVDRVAGDTLSLGPQTVQQPDQLIAVGSDRGRKRLEGLEAIEPARALLRLERLDRWRNGRAVLAAFLAGVEADRTGVDRPGPVDLHPDK